VTMQNAVFCDVTTCDANLATKFALYSPKAEALGRSIYFSCGLKATELVYSFVMIWVLTVIRLNDVSKIICLHFGAHPSGKWVS
jgi:hypothetical protein